MVTTTMMLTLLRTVAMTYHAVIIRNCQDADLAQVPRRCFAAAADAVCLMVQRWKPPVAEKCCHTP